MRPDQSLLHVVEDDEPEEPEVEYDHAVEPDPEPEPFTPPPAAAVVPELFEPELVARRSPSSPRPSRSQPSSLVEFEREPARPSLRRSRSPQPRWRSRSRSRPSRSCSPILSSSTVLEGDQGRATRCLRRVRVLSSGARSPSRKSRARARVAEPELVEHEPEPAASSPVEPVPVPQSEPAPAADRATPSRPSPSTTTRRSFAPSCARRVGPSSTQLQEMLADAMTALAALSAEAAAQAVRETSRAPSVPEVPAAGEDHRRAGRRARPRSPRRRASSRRAGRSPHACLERELRARPRTGRTRPRRAPRRSRSWPCSRALSTAIRTASTRLICPAPIPIVRGRFASTIAFERHVLADRPGEQQVGPASSRGRAARRPASPSRSSAPASRVLDEQAAEHALQRPARPRASRRSRSRGCGSPAWRASARAPPGRSPAPTHLDELLGDPLGRAPRRPAGSSATTPP